MVAIGRLSPILERVRMTACEHEMASIVEAISGKGGVGGYLDDMERIPGFSAANMRLAHLLCPTNFFDTGNKLVDVDKETRYVCWDYEAERGWRGPYIKCAQVEMPSAYDVRSKNSRTYVDGGFFPMASHFSVPSELRDGHGVYMMYGIPGEPAIIDPWGNPYVLQVPPAEAFDEGATDAERFKFARLVSAGPDGILSTPCFISKTSMDMGEGSYSWSGKQRLMRLGGLERGADGRTSASIRGDDVVVFLNRADVYE